MKYIIMGDPIPLARPRFSNRRVWDSQKHIKLVWAIELQRQNEKKILLTGPLRLKVCFYFAIPKSISNKKRNTIHNSLMFHRPDLDNLVKFVKDIGNKILYNDDAQVCVIAASKRYDDGNGPRTEFTLKQLTQKQIDKINKAKVDDKTPCCEDCDYCNSDMEGSNNER